MMMRWSAIDPVDDIEIARNNVIAAKQNRNPFIDYPGLEEYIWGTKTSESFDYTMGGSGETPTTVSTPTFSPAGGTYTTEQTVTISCATSGATIYYTTDGTTPSAASTKY
ncbi:MAG: chitobiase/beta-hexosaminidase C-terminal domain-containing protein, partial [Bacteroidaceae bacterium]|nr:chitobiase/beta-hexosaminidase C-terminal domain-containing protein [Bacteroidaceae bacterium]